MVRVADEPLERIVRLPCWSGRVDPAPLAGGITNKNYLVCDRGEKFVVRLGHDIPIHGIMRFNELAASRAAFEAGISPEVIYAEPGALVLRYIDGRTLTPELMRDPALLPVAVDLVKRCHEHVPRSLRCSVLPDLVRHRRFLSVDDRPDARRRHGVHDAERGCLGAGKT